MPMHVFVHTPQGRMFTLAVEASDTIGEVKRRIQDEQGIPRDRQRLFYFSCDTKDNMVLSTYNIQTGSSLQLEDRSSCYPDCLRRYPDSGPAWSDPAASSTATLDGQPGAIFF